MPDNAIMTPKEISKTVKMHHYIILSFLRDGKIRGIQFGKGWWKVRRDDFMQWLYECSNELQKKIMEEGGFIPNEN